jgi:hypothetical protein
LWDYVISPIDPEKGEFNMVKEVMKILFNPYISNSKQASLISDL